MRAPTFLSSSGSGMKKREASSMARTTSGGMIEPPRTVTTPTPLMTGLTPRPAYKEEGDEALRLTVVAAAAVAGEMAAVWRRRRRVSFMTIHYMICPQHVGVKN